MTWQHSQQAYHCLGRVYQVSSWRPQGCCRPGHCSCGVAAAAGAVSVLCADWLSTVHGAVASSCGKGTWLGLQLGQKKQCASLLLPQSLGRGSAVTLSNLIGCKSSD